jgi:DNA-binding transcriptional MerR regulator
MEGLMPMAKPRDAETDMPLRIGDLAARTGASHRTIHYYERLGLLHPLEREGGGHRQYDGEAIARLEKIAALKRLGLSLEDIASVLDLYFEDATGLRGKEKVLAILEGHLVEAKSRMADLSRFAADLETSIARMRDLIAQARRS